MTAGKHSDFECCTITNFVCPSGQYKSTSNVFRDRKYQPSHIYITGPFKCYEMKYDSNGCIPGLELLSKFDESILMDQKDRLSIIRDEGRNTTEFSESLIDNYVEEFDFDKKVFSFALQIPEISDELGVFIEAYGGIVEKLSDKTNYLICNKKNSFSLEMEEQLKELKDIQLISQESLLKAFEMATVVNNSDEYQKIQQILKSREPKISKEINSISYYHKKFYCSHLGDRAERQLEEDINNLGGIVTRSISNDLDYCVFDTDFGVPSNIEQIMKIQGITILNYKQYADLRDKYFKTLTEYEKNITKNYKFCMKSNRVVVFKTKFDSTYKEFTVPAKIYNYPVDFEYGSFDYTKIKTLKFEEGITSICDYAITKNAKINEIVLPNSLKTLGRIECTNLSIITIPESLKDIEKLERALKACKKLKIIKGSPNSKAKELAEILNCTYVEI